MRRSDFPEDTGDRSLVLLDACCLITLYATRRIREILETVTMRFAACELARSEATHVVKGGDGGDSNEREVIDLAPILEARLIEVVEPETDAEMSAFVNFAAVLDDGEATTCALAAHRGAVVATGERKARRILAARLPEVRTLGTPELVKRWAESGGVSRADLARVLADVQVRARFSPGRQDPLLAWWCEALSGL